MTEIKNRVKWFIKWPMNKMAVIKNHLYKRGQNGRYKFEIFKSIKNFKACLNECNWVSCDLTPVDLIRPFQANRRTGPNIFVNSISRKLVLNLVFSSDRKKIFQRLLQIFMYQKAWNFRGNLFTKWKLQNLKRSKGLKCLKGRVYFYIKQFVTP